MILKLLLNTQMIWTILIKILKNKLQIKKHKIFTTFEGMIAETHSNKKLNPIVTELFLRGRKLNFSIVFITHSNFAAPKNIRLISTHYFIMKIPNKWDFQQIAINHLLDINFKDFMCFYKKCSAKPYSVLVH